MKKNRRFAIALTLLVLVNGCIKKSDNAETLPPKPEPVVSDDQNKSTSPPASILEPQPMKLCVRPAHRLGVKKCVRSGKWIRLSLISNDVDNDRTDVFTSPRISLKKENFYQDTFRFEDGVNPVANYPDFYHIHAPYGGYAHFVFAMPNRNDLSITYGFAGRDEINDGRVRFLPNMNPNVKEYVKIQHWNDGRTFKKHASVYFQTLADYNETNFRYECGWMETEQGYDFTQTKTKENVEIPKIPETFIWRKIAESCEQLPSRSADGRFHYLPFRDIGVNPISLEHGFTLKKRNQVKIYNVKNSDPELTTNRLETLSPMNQTGMKMDGTTTLFTNSKKEEISRWESIYDEDLKDISFQPERQISK